jgi:hypothetical protein
MLFASEAADVQADEIAELREQLDTATAALVASAAMTQALEARVLAAEGAAGQRESSTTRRLQTLEALAVQQAALIADSTGKLASRLSVQEGWLVSQAGHLRAVAREADALRAEHEQLVEVTAAARCSSPADPAFSAGGVGPGPGARLHMDAAADQEASSLEPSMQQQRQQQQRATASEHTASR